MAAKDDKSKTSKTARVMNLLSKKQDSAPVTEDTPETSTLTGTPAPAAPTAPQVPPLLASIDSDAAVSGQIRSALEDALESELSPAPDPMPSVEDIFAPPPAPPRPAPAAPAQEPPAAPVQEPLAAPTPEPPAPQQQPAPDSVNYGVGYVNVMQVLVEEKAPKYVKMFGLCDCRRCLEDVKALALNHLPPKYVVMDQGDMIPKLTFYEGKYSSDITAQLLQACKKVMETPHHDR